jgi:hypothetical protein
MRNDGRLQQCVPVDCFVWYKLLPLNACNLLMVAVNFGIETIVMLAGTFVILV